MNVIGILDAEGLKKDVPTFRPGDRVKVHVRVVEGDKSRIQVFEGDVIGRRSGTGLRATFTVRKTSGGVGWSASSRCTRRSWRRSTWCGAAASTARSCTTCASSRVRRRAFRSVGAADRMALDREKAFANAERLLKQGRVSSALDEYRRIAEDAPRDVLTQNRIGDALARAGRTDEAIAYYDRAGEHFAQAGFYPRAIAILKKVVKLAPKRTDVIVKLADLYVRQNLAGEARPYFLQAADTFLKSHQFAKTREVYQKLVTAEPGDLVNRVRLAEARAAEGDTIRAGDDLLAVAGAMVTAGRFEDAERTFRRAAELLPDRIEPLAGMVTCFAQSGRGDQAISAIDAALARRPADARLAGEKLVLLESLGKPSESASFLAGPQAVSLRDEDVLRAFQEACERKKSEEFLQRLDVPFGVWRGSGRTDRVAHLLDRFSLAFEGGWPPALDRLLALRTEEKAPPRALARLIERTIAAHEAHGNVSRLKDLRDRLAVTVAAAGPPSGVAEASAGEAASSSPAGAQESDDSPAVPLTPQDHEAVSGHITEAEVFLKYGLQSEAHEQLRELVRRFPGHVPAVQRFVEFLRVRPDRDELRGALVTLALALRAAGDHVGARQAASEACVGGLAPESIETLKAVGLWLPPAGAASVVAAPVRATAASQSKADAPAPPRAAAATAAPPPAAAVVRVAPAPPPISELDRGLVVDFDGDSAEVIAPIKAASTKRNVNDNPSTGINYSSSAGYPDDQA